MGSETLPVVDRDTVEMEQEVIDSDEEREQERDRGAEYLDFRRKFDAMKSEVAGQQSKAESLKQQGNNLFSLDCFAQAAIMYSEAIELQPKNAVLYCNRSMAYLKQEMPDEALQDAEKSLELDSSVENIKAYWRKSQALLDLNRIDEAEAAADDGILLQPGNQHLNKVRRKAREARVLQQLSNGQWVGSQNGMERKMLFNADGSMSMSVFGHSVGATFDLSVEGLPRSMLVKMKGEEVGFGTGPPPPPVPYIFEFRGDDELWLCHSLGGPGEAMPSKFEGPGFIKMRREAREDGAASALSNEPLDVRCLRYMQEWNEVMPLVPPQLPEKPSNEQVEDEVRITAKLSALKRRDGLEVHRRAVVIAKDPATALAGNPTLTAQERSTLSQTADEFRKRLMARRLITPEEVATESHAEPTPATGGATLFHIGAEIEVHGLTGAKELNGASGRLLQFDAETGRWAVELQRKGGEPSRKRIRAENLRLANAAASEAALRQASRTSRGSPLGCLAGFARSVCTRKES
mmetsp:Transcript_63790/g.118507  ORF Transcript_63790/g.118507 Transcript_63790/m.118507 type:complete len:520 (+) Transcript_63790:68-1627(+)